jgi:hypothetical protein
MTKADEYRRQAAICFRAAQEVPDALRVQLLDMAASWQALAEHAERNSKLDLVYETPPVPTGQQPVQQQQQQIQPPRSDDAET